MLNRARAAGASIISMSSDAKPQRAERQLDGARRLLAHLAELLQADLSVRLWNGELVPLGPHAAASPAFHAAICSSSNWRIDSSLVGDICILILPTLRCQRRP